MSPQNALDLLILKTLQSGPNHGFGITLHIQRVSDGLLSVEEGSLYPALRRLERDRFLSAKWTTTDNNRRARVYSLTKKGRERLAEEQQGWVSLSAGVSKILGYA